MCTTIETLGNLYEVVREWEDHFFQQGLGFPAIWYRGQADSSWELQPTVLRQWFIDRVLEGDSLIPDHIRLGQRERTINDQFRRMAASLLPGNASCADVYFLSQHHGMPTRLLDWTTSPLVALFCAANSHQNVDGTIFAMNPRPLIPFDEGNPDSIFPPDVVNARHSIVEQAIRPMYGQGQPFPQPFVLPIHPDLQAGRMLQQNSCFTLHMPPVNGLSDEGVPVVEPFMQLAEQNNTLQEYRIPGAAKADLLVDLRRSGINFATIFADLDNISREVRTAWQLYP